MFVLGAMIILPYFFFALSNKIMNDPHFEGLGDYNFDANEVLKLLHKSEFKDLIRAKIWYIIVLALQVLMSFGLIISLMVGSTGQNFMGFLHFTVFLSIFATGLVINYIWKRKELPFDNNLVSELDYYSVISMGISNWWKLLGKADTELNTSHITLSNNSPEPSAPSKEEISFVQGKTPQQGGANSVIETYLPVPGLNQEDMKRKMESILRSDMEPGDLVELWKNTATIGKILIVVFILIVFIIWLIMTFLLIHNNTNKLDTTLIGIGTTIYSFMIIGIIIYLGYSIVSFYKKVFGEQIPDPEKLMNSSPMEYVILIDNNGKKIVRKIPKGNADQIRTQIDNPKGPIEIHQEQHGQLYNTIHEGRFSEPSKNSTETKTPLGDNPIPVQNSRPSINMRRMNVVEPSNVGKIKNPDETEIELATIQKVVPHRLSNLSNENSVETNSENGIENESSVTSIRGLTGSRLTRSSSLSQLPN
jgi:hypothetical protein